MEVEKIIKTTKEAELEIEGATLLTIEEAESLHGRLRAYDDWWWLQSPGDCQFSAASVRKGGSVDYTGDYVNYDDVCVRPALRIGNLKSFQVGDCFIFGNKEFEIVTEELAFCTGDIGRCAFRKNRETEDANVYEKSDVKKFVDRWFEEARENTGDEL